MYETRIQSSFKLFILRLIAHRHAFAPGWSSCYFTVPPLTQCHPGPVRNCQILSTLHLAQNAVCVNKGMAVSETRCGSERFGFFRLPLTNTDDCGRTSVTRHSRCTYRAQSQSNLVSQRLERTLVPKMHSNFLFTSSDSEVTWPWRASLLVLPTLPVKRTSKGKMHRYITEVNPVTRIHIQSSL